MRELGREGEVIGAGISPQPITSTPTEGGVLDPKVSIKNIDHFAIVAGLIDEIEIVETVNYKLGIDPREKISAGVLVKAILINGLGFVSRPLYLFKQFL